MEDLKDYGAVVIGTGGVGRGIALALGQEGMHVAVADLNAATADAVAAEIRDAGGDAVAVETDATSTASLTALADDAVGRFGDVRLLVSTVGVITDRRLDAATEEDWAWFFEFNVMAGVRSVNAFLPHLRAATPEPDATRTMCPRLRSIIGPAAALIQWKLPVRFVRTTRSHSSGSNSQIGLMMPSGPPATLTTASTRPHSSTQRATTCSTSG